MIAFRLFTLSYLHSRNVLLVCLYLSLYLSLQKDFSAFTGIGPKVAKRNIDDMGRLFGLQHPQRLSFVYGREMECIESSSYNTFYPFQYKHQIYRYIQSVKMLCAYEKHREIHEMGQANQRPQISINDEHSIYSISLVQGLRPTAKCIRNYWSGCFCLYEDISGFFLFIFVFTIHSALYVKFANDWI